MSSVVEEAVKVLAAFENELDRAKAEAVEAKKRVVRVAAEESDKARKDALAKAQSVAGERIQKAREEAETEAAAILAKGKGSLKALSSRISKKSDEALELVTKQLLGD